MVETVKLERMQRGKVHENDRETKWVLGCHLLLAKQFNLKWDGYSKHIDSVIKQYHKKICKRKEKNALETRRHKYVANCQTYICISVTQGKKTLQCKWSYTFLSSSWQWCFTSRMGLWYSERNNQKREQENYSILDNSLEISSGSQEDFSQ